MKSKKKLIKGQNGIEAGPMTQKQAAQAAFRSAENNPANDPNNEMFIPTPYKPAEPGPIVKKKGGSVIKGSSLRRQTSTKGLRTSKKH